MLVEFNPGADAGAEVRAGREVALGGDGDILEVHWLQAPRIAAEAELNRGPVRPPGIDSTDHLQPWHISA